MWDSVLLASTSHRCGRRQRSPTRSAPTRRASSPRWRAAGAAATSNVGPIPMTDACACDHHEPGRAVKDAVAGRDPARGGALARSLSANDRRVFLRVLGELAAGSRLSASAAPDTEEPRGDQAQRRDRIDIGPSTGIEVDRVDDRANPGRRRTGIESGVELPAAGCPSHSATRPSCTIAIIRGDDRAVADRCRRAESFRPAARRQLITSGTRQRGNDVEDRHRG